MPRNTKTSEARVPPKGGAARGGSALAGGPHLDECNYYLVTIKCNHLLHTTREALDQAHARLVKRVKRAEWSDLKVYEDDSMGRMHIHTYCLIRGKTPYFRNLQEPGWTIDFSYFPWTDQMFVINYFHKHDQTENAITQRFEENWFRFGYHFDGLPIACIN